jgi:hypothetical protein
MSEALTSPRLTVDDDPRAFNAFAMERGWGDGLPLVPPTPALVEKYISASGLASDHVIAALPPRNADCTVERLAINAAMTLAPPAAMPLMVAALDAMADPGFALHALNATTGSVVPAVVVNGPIRRGLELPMGAGLLGGVAGSAPAIGRALRLVMRNVAGQLIGVTSQSVFGQPGRVAGIVFAEWEERSPWAPFAERRGVPGDAVTVYGAMGTANICDLVADTGSLLLEIIGKSLAYPAANGFLTSSAFSETMVVINPVWAELIARDVPDIAEVQQQIWTHARRPLDTWAEPYHAPFEKAGRVLPGGLVPLVPSPEDVFVVVGGGEGNLHAAALHSWGDTRTTTRGVRAG